ncbi:MAG: hypothetical protein WCJ30_23085 [Deltaproteobacteria bacterium]
MLERDPIALEAFRIANLRPEVGASREPIPRQNEAAKPLHDEIVIEKAARIRRDDKQLRALEFSAARRRLYSFPPCTSR